MQNSTCVYRTTILNIQTDGLLWDHPTINKSTIEQLLIPTNISQEIQQEISDLAKKIHILKKLKQDTSILEHRIDEIVSQLLSLETI